MAWRIAGCSGDPVGASCRTLSTTSLPTPAPSRDGAVTTATNRSSGAAGFPSSPSSRPARSGAVNYLCFRKHQDVSGLLGGRSAPAAWATPGRLLAPRSASCRSCQPSRGPARTSGKVRRTAQLDVEDRDEPQTAKPCPYPAVRSIGVAGYHATGTTHHGVSTSSLREATHEHRP